jgi:hypothetical protein
MSTTTKIDTVISSADFARRVKALCDEAGAAGDTLTMRDCERVLDGRRAGAAERRVAHVLLAAEAQADS